MFYNTNTHTVPLPTLATKKSIVTQVCSQMETHLYHATSFYLFPTPIRKKTRNCIAALREPKANQDARQLKNYAHLFGAPKCNMEKKSKKK